MASETYQFWFYAGANAGADGPLSLNAANSGSAAGQPIVEADGTIDGMTAYDGAVTWDGTTYYYQGFTEDGDPIFTAAPGGNGVTLVFTNQNLDGRTVNTTQGGTYTYCFAAGSLIATPEGETRVEHLRIGDMVRTVDGALTPVKWLGHQRLSRYRHGVHGQPVRIRAGALGNGLPHSDLVVTADHGMVLDGYVINASALVNGDTIAFVPLEEMGGDSIVYHVETETHSVILANGAPAETFIDVAGRRGFDNYDEYLSLYGAERIIPALPQPRISAARHLPPAIRQRLGCQPRGLGVG
jgi:hypothetical protein